jgi:tetratricopeptide (TPR) repeat protein
MKGIKFVSAVFTLLIGLQSNFAQTVNELPPLPRAMPAPNPTPKISETVSKNLAQLTDKTPVSRERREQAYVKLLEGQRYLWIVTPPRRSTAATRANNLRLAKESLQKAVELNPVLAEGYTLLAELTLSVPPPDMEDALTLANIAVKIEPENFGGHRILARLYTIKSRLNNGILDPTWTQKAVSEWKEVGRLDPRNAEAFAFLSEFYARTKMPAERIDALRKWLASATPLDPYFYGRVMGERADLSPESATVKYGRALLETGETREAIEVLSRAIADNPENGEAVEILQRAVETADVASTATAIQALQQAVFANPENTTLIEILAQIQAGAGKTDEAAKILRDSSAKIAVKNITAAAALQISAGDIYIEANRFDEAVATYQNALTLRGIGDAEAITDDERDFAIRVFDKIINAYKKANRPDAAKVVIERARLVLGKADLFADKRLISFYLETGKKNEALQAVRALRAKNADDDSLLRIEATILTDSGRVDEAVELIKATMKEKPAVKSGRGIGNGNGGTTFVLPTSDEFSNFLFISNLYSQARRGKEAADAANQAYATTENTERRQIAKLTLATAQQMAGDFQGAEKTLRDILRQSPGNPIALNNLGYFLTERDEKLDEALKLIERAVEIDPTNPSYLDSLGWAYFKLGKLPEAEKYLKEAARIDDSSATIHEHLGDVYRKQGKPEAAKASWEKALTLTSEAEEITRIKVKINVKTLK